MRMALIRLDRVDADSEKANPAGIELRKTVLETP
jgi:hypothetical protein